MAMLSELRDGYDLEVSSPAGLFEARLTGAWTVGWTVDRSRLSRTAAPRLASEAQAALRLLWVARIRAERETEIRFFDGVLPERGPRLDPMMLRYDELRAEINAVGEAADGRVRVEAQQGFSTFVVLLADDVPTMDGGLLELALTGATQDMIADQREQVRALKQEFYADEIMRLRAELEAGLRP